jgi:hypothetical protein
MSFKTSEQPLNSCYPEQRDALRQLSNAAPSPLILPGLYGELSAQTEQSRENHNPTVAILKVGGMNHGLKQEAYGIDEDVTLLAFDLLARVVAARVDAALPFKAGWRG